MRSRGQTLVLFCLTLLLLALMVLMTIGIGARAHDRMELQVSTDASAYSEAVLTARAFNSISLLNRVQVAQMVSMAATESLISWSGAVYGELKGIPEMLTLAEAIPPGNTPACMVPINKVITSINTKLTTIDTQWKNKDMLAGQDAMQIQGIASGIRSDQVKILTSLLDQMSEGARAATSDPATDCTPSCGNILPPGNGKDMVTAIVSRANKQLRAPNGAYWKSQQEVTNAAALNSDSPTTDSVYATMGSRGDTWVTARSGSYLDPQIATWSGIPVFGTEGAGGSGFGQGPGMGNSHKAQIYGQSNSYAVYAHDHADTATLVVPCTDGTFVPITAYAQAAWVYSSEKQQNDDQHHYGAAEDPTSFEDQYHTMGACVVCDGIWPFFMDYNSTKVGDAVDLNAQPVLFAMARRDYGAISADSHGAADPWNLLFNFKFSNGQTFDNGNQNGIMSTNPAYEFQVALSAGIAYYHRPGHAREPPNFFNPFWRATLVPLEADMAKSKIKNGAGDAVTALKKAGYGKHANALTQIEGAGYRGTELGP